LKDGVPTRGGESTPERDDWVKLSEMSDIKSGVDEEDGDIGSFRGIGIGILEPKLFRGEVE
jgi:hypothetical protein